VRRSARAVASRLLKENVEALERAGYRVASDSPDFDVHLEAPSRPSVRARMLGTGRVFGGSYAFELSTAEPVLPKTEGLAGRGKGLVRLERVEFRARRGDAAGARVAALVNRDDPLQRALDDVHFERIAIEPDGRVAIRQMGGSVVWVLFPPVVRGIPLVEDQARATVAALDAFAALGTARA